MYSEIRSKFTLFTPVIWTENNTFSFLLMDMRINDDAIEALKFKSDRFAFLFILNIIPDIRAYFISPDKLFGIRPDIWSVIWPDPWSVILYPAGYLVSYLVSDRIFGQLAGIRADILSVIWYPTGYLVSYLVSDRIFGQLFGIRADIWSVI